MQNHFVLCIPEDFLSRPNSDVRQMADEVGLNGAVDITYGSTAGFDRQYKIQLMMGLLSQKYCIQRELDFE